MIIALCCRKLLTFLYVLLIARYASLYTTGLFFFLMAVVGVLGLVMDLGLSPVFIRESSRNLEKLPEYLGNTIGIKVIMCPVGILAAFLIVWLIDYPQVTKQLLYVIILIVVLDSFSMTFFGCLRANQRLKYEARGMITGHAIMFALGSFFLWRGYSILFLVLAVLANTAFNFLYSIWSIRSRLDIVPKILYEWSIIRAFVKEAFPFLVGALLGAVLFVDTLILSYFSDMGNVALFGIPASVVRSLQLIPVALVTAVYPEMSYLKDRSQERLDYTFQRSVYSLCVVGIPIAAGLSVLASDFLILVYGVKFSKSALPLQILAISLIPVFLNHLIGTLLNACNRQTTNTILRGISATVHISLCFILIPLYDVIGAAIVGLVSNTLLLGLGTYWALKILKKEITVYLPDMARIAISALFMGSCVFYLKSVLHFLITIPIGMILYGACLVTIERLTIESGPRSKALTLFADFCNSVFVKKQFL